MFRSIQGQSNALQILKMAIENDRIAQAYLFHGIDGVGKFTTALYFGMALNCFSKSEFRPCGVCTSCRKFLALDHPDLIYIFPTPKLDLSAEGEIKKSEVQKQYEGYILNKKESPWQEYLFSSSIEIRRENISLLIKRLDLSIYEANYRICIIEDADEMNIESANAFLKTLEEPPQNTVIILTTNRLSMILPTIQSRCQPIYFQPVTPCLIESIVADKFHVPLEYARIASRIADGSVKRAMYLVQNETSAIRDRAYEIFQMAVHNKDLDFYKSINGRIDRLNAESTIELIKYISLFVGDLNLMKTAPDLVVNIDKLGILQEAFTLICEMDDAVFADKALNFLLTTEDLVRKIYGNVNLQLVMINLFYQLRNIFRD